MKIIQKFDQNSINSIDNSLIEDCKKGSCVDWNRKFLIQSLCDEKLAIVSLNFFERIVYALEQFFCCNTNNYFQNVFETKNVRVVPSESFSQVLSPVNQQTKLIHKVSESVAKIEPLIQKNLIEQPVAPETKIEPAKEIHLAEPQYAINEGNPLAVDPNDLVPNDNPLAEAIEIPLNNPEEPDNQGEEEPEAIDGVEVVEIPEENLLIKSIEELIQEGNLDEALEATEKTYPGFLSPQRETFLKEIARAYFKLDDFKKTNTVVWQLSFGRLDLIQEFVAESCHAGKYEAVRILSSRDNPFCEIFIQNLIHQGNLDEALKACKKISPSGEKNFYKQLANAYLELNNFEKSYESLNELDYAEKEALCKEYAYKCCREGHYDDAKTFVSDTDAYCKIFLVVAEEHYQADRLDLAMAVLSCITNNRNDDNEILALKVAEKHIENGDLDKAAEIASKIIYLHEDSSKLLAQLASLYFEQGELEKALTYVIYNEDLGATKLLYTRIAEAYHQKDDKINALKALRKMTMHGKLIDVFNLSIAKDYIEQENYDAALRTIMASQLR